MNIVENCFANVLQDGFQVIATMELLRMIAYTDL